LRFPYVVSITFATPTNIFLGHRQRIDIERMKLILQDYTCKCKRSQAFLRAPMCLHRVYRGKGQILGELTRDRLLQYSDIETPAIFAAFAIFLYSAGVTRKPIFALGSIFLFMFMPKMGCPDCRLVDNYF
jgi:hypothetical protein